MKKTFYGAPAPDHSGRHVGGHSYGHLSPEKPIHTTVGRAWTEEDIRKAIELTVTRPQWAGKRGTRRVLRRDIDGTVFEARYSYSSKRNTSTLLNFHPIAGKDITIYLHGEAFSGVHTYDWLKGDFMTADQLNL
ncbi:MAG: hypothetical protein PUG30_04085 [Actinomycetaceae bacterium]|nr:hypothetical protein [Actinomycetaceae bacterium]